MVSAQGEVVGRVVGGVAVGWVGWWVHGVRW